MEHIVTLRLLTDSARGKSKKLFVTFIDFSKACDVMPRHKMFITLKRLVCGMMTLATLIVMHNLTESVLLCNNYISCCSQVNFINVVSLVYYVCR